ncbi:hypothetical protein VAZ01S_052_00200 [Vibrio azureus NBRC 104587]|uniref:Uncharacterized protein n=1 Tax=Vibrio azureus NBRC 104587 TaxID=1219077 RepID=U3AU65_9VIBR|nr:hypothetical protein VAZ01S_052_00200 [Vibrio azureus NBRC 104587]
MVEKAAEVTLLSVSLVNSTSGVITNTSSPKLVAQAMEKSINSFPKGAIVFLNLLIPRRKYGISKNDDRSNQSY